MTDVSKIPFRVLSLDGGGTRGLYTATYLECLAERFATRLNRPAIDIGKGFDLIVGTSTGGILAAALVAGVPIRKVIDLYRHHGPKIFTDPQPETRGGFALWCFRNFSKAANSANPLRKALADIFGETTLGELYSRRQIALCITAVKLIDEKLRVFKTPHIPLKDLHNTTKLVDVCLATSAAPIFLPLAMLKSPQDDRRVEVYADGGLAANNPVLIGLVEALQLAGDRPIHILSAGTCAAPGGDIFSERTLNQGLFGWRAGARALTLSMNAQASAAEHTVSFLADWMCKHGKEVRVVRFPEERRSGAQIKFLRMDLASEAALDAFTGFGSEDAVSAYKLCQQADHPEGQVITDIFSSMPSFNTNP